MSDIYNQPSYFGREKSFYVKYLDFLINTFGEDIFKGKILDAGSGAGEMMEIISDKFPKVDLYGVDISHYGVDKTKKSGFNAKLTDLNKKIPFPDNTFDLLYSKSVIEHLLDPDAFIEECHRVLKPGGKLIVATPNLLAWYQRIFCLFGIIPTFMELSTRDKNIGLGKLGKVLGNANVVGHIRVFNALGLKSIFERYDFVNVKLKGLKVDYPFPPAIKIIFNSLDSLFSLIPSLSSALVLYAQKPKK